MLAHSSPTPAQRSIRGPRVSRGRLHVTAAVKAKSARQVCCSKTLVAKPETKDAVKQLCAEVTQFSQQAMAERSNGIQEFSCVTDAWEDNVFHFWERYDSNKHLGRHNTKPEIEQFMRNVVPLLEQPVGMALYEYRNGQIGAVSMQAGPKGEGGLDDATGASGAAGGASYKQTSRLTQLTTLEDDEDEGPSSSSTSTSSGGGMNLPAEDDAAGGLPPAAIAAAAVGVLGLLAFTAMQMVGH